MKFPEKWQAIFELVFIYVCVEGLGKEVGGKSIDRGSAKVLSWEININSSHKGNKEWERNREKRT